MKNDDGAIGILGNEDTILKQEMAIYGPFLSEMTKSSTYKDSGTANLVLHHGSTNLFECESFHQHFALLSKFIQMLENRFESNEISLINIISRKVSLRDFFREAVKAFNVGKQEKPTFIQERLCNHLGSISSL